MEFRWHMCPSSWRREELGSSQDLGVALTMCAPGPPSGRFRSQPFVPLECKCHVFTHQVCWPEALPFQVAVLFPGERRVHILQTGGVGQARAAGGKGALRRVVCSRPRAATTEHQLDGFDDRNVLSSLRSGGQKSASRWAGPCSFSGCCPGLSAGFW